MLKISSKYLDIAYGMAKDMAVAGKLPANPKAVAKFARALAHELALDFTEPDATA